MVLNSNDITSRLKNKNMSFADENFEVQYGQRNRVYNALCILIYFLQSIKETCKKDIYQGIKKYDSILNHLPSGYGFFDNWQQDTFWTN